MNWCALKDVEAAAGEASEQELSDTEEEFRTQVRTWAVSKAQRHICLCICLCLPCTDGMPCLQFPQVCTMACFVAPLNISLHLLIACLQHYWRALQSCTSAAGWHWLHQPMWLLHASAHMAPSSVQHPCAASHLPTLAAICYCIVTGDRHWV